METFSEFKIWMLGLLGLLKIEETQGDTLITEVKKPAYLPALVYISVPVFFYLLWIVMFSLMPFLQESLIKFKPTLSYPEFVTEANPGPAELLFLQENRVKKLDKIYAKFSNRQSYLVVNTSDNTFTLFNNGKLVREGLCSTGSFVLLDAGDEKKWMFETPKGMMRIQGKTESPVWRKPD